MQEALEGTNESSQQVLSGRANDMRSKYLGLLIIISFSLLVPSVRSTEYQLNVEHMPYEGNTDTPIVVFVTTSPMAGSKSWYLYLFWDDIPVKDGMADVKIATGSYEHRWRFSFYPPKDRATKGSHYVQIWVYDHEGTIGKKTFFYNIKSVVPRLEWWEDLPPEFVETLRGQDGVDGAKGDLGEKGDSIVGPAGIQGPQGEQGPVGSQGPEGIGIDGPMGPIGIDGVQGVRGEPGKSYPGMVFNVVVIFSVFSLLISLVTIFYRRKENEER